MQRSRILTLDAYRIFTSFNIQRHLRMHERYMLQFKREKVSRKITTKKTKESADIGVPLEEFVPSQDNQHNLRPRQHLSLKLSEQIEHLVTR